MMGAGMTGEEVYEEVCWEKGLLSEVVESGVCPPVKPWPKLWALLREVVRRVGGCETCCLRRGSTSGALWECGTKGY